MALWGDLHRTTILRRKGCSRNHFFSNGEQNIEILPQTLDGDTSNLIQSINKYMNYPEMCKEMEAQGTIYFEVGRDTLEQFSQIKSLRGIDSLCTELVSKEIKQILKKAPVIEVSNEINSFILAISIHLWKR